MYKEREITNIYTRAKNQKSDLQNTFEREREREFVLGQKNQQQKGKSGDGNKKNIILLLLVK